MRDTPDDGRPGAARPDLEPTINEAGASGFVVDGTDSFAVPGPTEELVADDAVAVAAVSRTRILVTVGAVVAGLLFVIAVGSGGGSGSAEDRLRTEREDAAGPSFTLPPWGGDDALTVIPLPVGPMDDETLRLLEERGLTQDDLLAEPATTVFDEFAELDEFDDFDDFDSLPDIADDEFDPFDDDFDFPTYRPGVTAPRRAVTPTRRGPIVRVTTVPPAPDDTTAPSEQTTTTASTAPTTTIADTTTSSSTAPPPPPPPPSPAWQAAALGLPDCPAALRLWSTGDRLIAGAGGLFVTTDPRQGWSRLGADLPALRDVRAFVGGPNGSTFWVASADGVFGTTDGGTTLTELGDLADVRSLGVATTGPAAGAFAVTGGGVVRWDEGGGTWVAVDGPPSGAASGHLIIADDGAVVLGSPAGVARSTDGGQTWTTVSSTPVVGPALRVGSSYAWLGAGGAGVLRSDGAASWTLYPAGGQVADDAAALSLSAGELVAPGDGAARLIRSTDGGTTWADVQPAPPYRPTGLAHLGTSLVAVTTDCAAGVPGGADSVVVLAG